MTIDIYYRGQWVDKAYNLSSAVSVMHESANIRRIKGITWKVSGASSTKEETDAYNQLNYERDLLIDCYRGGK